MPTRSQLNAIIAANLSDGTLIVPSKHREVEMTIADYIDQEVAAAVAQIYTRKKKYVFTTDTTTFQHDDLKNSVIVDSTLGGLDIEEDVKFEFDPSTGTIDFSAGTNPEGIIYADNDNPVTLKLIITNSE